MRFIGETVMQRSIFNVLFGTFTLRFSTALTGGLLAYYLANLPKHCDVLGQCGVEVTAFAFAVIHAAFYATELIVSPLFGLLSDKLGHHRVMQFGPLFGAVAVMITAVSTNLVVLGGTRVLEGAATAASIPSILGFLAMATSSDEGLRGKVSARFELATLAGLGAGIGASGIFWALFGPVAFFVNAAFYLGSLAIYRFGVKAPDAPAGPHHRPQYGWRRYASLLRTSHIWLLAPTWIALNAAIGVYAGTGLFNLVRDESEKFPDQILAGGLSTLEITLGMAAVAIVFVAGLIYWGNRFKTTRRTTIIFYGIVGGAALVVAAITFNHSAGIEMIYRLPLAIVAAAGLFLLAGATPAALGLLADMSEAYPDDRGAVMGLYGVFLALGQIIGNLVGGWASDRAGFDGIFVATLVFVAIAVVPLFWLRRYEDQFEAGPTGATA
jgi:MFS family permease